jgi:RHS repeat-associated protein
MARANPFRFSTKYQDDETDLVMYPRRAYNPSTGRWLSRDPSADLSAQPAALPPVTYSDTELAEEDEPDGNTPPDLLAMVRPAYRFVDNNPIAHFDPLGEDIYLQRGNNMPTPNRWLHMSVCVDLWHCRNGGWQKTGKACFSFWATGLRFSLPSNRWLGWREFNAGGPLEGKIYQDPYVSGKVVGQLTTTVKQDTKWYMYMLVTRVGTADTYSLARHNCRRYSKNEFRDAPWNMGLP